MTLKIWAADHSIIRNDATTGHMSRVIAYCQDNATAKTLASSILLFNSLDNLLREVSDIIPTEDFNGNMIIQEALCLIERQDI